MNGAASLHELDQNRVAFQLASPHRLADAENVLIDDPPRPDVQMSHLGISHLSGRQPDRLPASFERGPGRLAEQRIEPRLPGRSDGIPLALFSATEAVEDDEYEERAFHGGGTIPKSNDERGTMNDELFIAHRSSFIVLYEVAFSRLKTIPM